MRSVSMRGVIKSLGVHTGCWAILSAVVIAGAPRLMYGQTNPQSRTADKAASMTGCVDEDNGRYILVDEHELKPIADLQAEGFPTEDFARSLGHKVIVRGIVSPGDGRPLFKVRSIKKVSETCAPQQYL
jgi:hypothetical protein